MKQLMCFTENFHTMKNVFSETLVLNTSNWKKRLMKWGHTQIWCKKSIPAEHDLVWHLNFCYLHASFLKKNDTWRLVSSSSTWGAAAIIKFKATGSFPSPFSTGNPGYLEMFKFKAVGYFPVEIQIQSLLSDFWPRYSCMFSHHVNARVPWC